MLTAILIILCVDLFFRLIQFGANANVMTVLNQIEVNTRGYGK